MQTFLPCRSFEHTAKCLDRARLGKQRVETLQILNSLHTGTGWNNHPATKMWRGYQQLLVRYGVAICDEWISRGYKDSCKRKVLRYLKREEVAIPRWMQDDRVLRSHRKALLYKDFEHYHQFGWKEKPAIPNAKNSLPYFWPREDDMVRVVGFDEQQLSARIYTADLSEWFEKPEIEEQPEVVEEQVDWTPKKITFGKKVRKHA